MLIRLSQQHFYIFKLMRKVLRRGVGIIVLSFILCSLSHSNYGQELTYTINLRGGKIGEVNATRKVQSGKEIYEVISDVTFKVLWKSYNRVTENYLTFENGQIQSSLAAVYMNKTKEDSAAMHLINDKYSCYLFPDKKYEIENAKIDFFAAKLYFEEPINVKSVFTERFLEYSPLTHLGNNQYKLSLPNGKENIYTYKNGILVEVLIDRTWFVLKFEIED